MRHGAVGRPVRAVGPVDAVEPAGAGTIGSMGELQLITVELRFKTRDDPGQLADRIREATALIVGREALEEFRFRAMPLESKDRKRDGPL